jgi:hypothetical protein
VPCSSFHEVELRALSEGLDIPNDFPIWARQYRHIDFARSWCFVVLQVWELVVTS